MSESRFVELMSSAIAATDGSEAEALAMFELQLLEASDPKLVWDLFEPVRGILLRRLYRMAQYQIDQVSEAQPNYGAQPTLSTGTASEPAMAADSSEDPQSSHRPYQHSAVSDIANRRRLTQQHTTARSPRNATTAQAVLMNIGGRKSHLDSVYDRHGTPIGNLNYYGLANAHDEAPQFQRYARRLMESGIPKSDRPSDIVRRFITPEEADRLWLAMLKEVA